MRRAVLFRETSFRVFSDKFKVTSNGAFYILLCDVADLTADLSLLAPSLCMHQSAYIPCVSLLNIAESRNLTGRLKLCGDLVHC